MDIEKVKKEAAYSSLKEMFSNTSFSICTITSIEKMLKCQIDSETKEIMQSLHCVDYADMSKELRTWLFETTTTCFSDFGFEFSHLNKLREVDVTPKKEKGILRMFG